MPDDQRANEIEKRIDRDVTGALAIVPHGERVICGNATISAKMVAGAHLEFERAPHRDFRVSVKKLAC